MTDIYKSSVELRLKLFCIDCITMAKKKVSLEIKDNPMIFHREVFRSLHQKSSSIALSNMQTLFSVLSWSTFGSSEWPADLLVRWQKSFFFEDLLQLCWVSGWTTEGCSVVPKTPLCCLGCVLRVTVLLEGEPSAQSKVRLCNMFSLSTLCRSSAAGNLPWSRMLLQDVWYSLYFNMRLQHKLWKRWKGLKTSTSIPALFASIDKRIFAAVFCCVPNTLLNPEFLQVQKSLLLLQIPQLSPQIHHFPG